MPPSDRAASMVLKEDISTSLHLNWMKERLLRASKPKGQRSSSRTNLPQLPSPRRKVDLQ